MTRGKYVRTKSIRKKLHGRAGSHHMSGTLFYSLYRNLLNSCSNPRDPKYKNNGAKGIKICPRWLDFSLFKEDMYEDYCHAAQTLGESPSLDRIDCRKDFSPDNCRWVERRIKMLHHFHPDYSYEELQKYAEVYRNREISLITFHRVRKAGASLDDIMKVPAGMSLRTIKMAPRKEELDLGKIPARSAQMISYRYGMEDGRIKTLKETGIKFGVTRQAVDMIIRKYLPICKIK